MNTGVRYQVYDQVRKTGGIDEVKIGAQRPAEEAGDSGSLPFNRAQRYPQHQPFTRSSQVAAVLVALVAAILIAIDRMSVIQKASPLNLMGKVAIITSASTPLGSQTCRTLLRHNCLVLGIDSAPVTESEHRLFSALNTHFQTLQLNLGDENAVVKMAEHVKDRFWKTGFDILITFAEDDSIQLRKEIVEIMRGSGGGVILNVLDEGSVGQSADIVELAGRSASTGVRTSVVLVDGHAKGSQGWTMLGAPEGAMDEAKECVERFRALTEEDTDTEKGNRGVADLLLFLVSELGRAVTGAVVTSDGGWKSL